MAIEQESLSAMLDKLEKDRDRKAQVADRAKDPERNREKNLKGLQAVSGSVGGPIAAFAHGLAMGQKLGGGMQDKKADELAKQATTLQQQQAMMYGAPTAVTPAAPPVPSPDQGDALQASQQAMYSSPPAVQATLNRDANAMSDQEAAALAAQGDDISRQNWLAYNSPGVRGY